MEPNNAQETQPVSPITQPPVSSAPEQPSRSKVSKWVYIGIIILLLLVAVGITTYFLNKNFASKTLPTPIPSATITVTPSETKVSSESAWLSTIDMTTPGGWNKIICDNLVAFNPKEGVNSCGTEPGAFAIIVYKSDSYSYDDWKKDSSADVSNLKENLIIAGKKASQFDLKYTQGQPAGDYKKTILFVGDGSYINIDLNHLAYVDIYNQFVSSIKFTNQNQITCNTDNDCQNGAKCLVSGPLIANQPSHKVCVPEGQVVPN